MIRLRPHIDLVPESAAELVAPYIEDAKRVLIGKFLFISVS